MKKIIFTKLYIDCIIFFLIALLSASIIIWVFQSVNYLDIVIDDSRDFIIYFKYITFIFPKIVTKILPFAIFFSFTYVLSRYEQNNELIIFWTFGINKIQLINFILKNSLLLLFLQLFFTVYLVPKSQQMSREIMRNSNINFYDGFLKPKKFNDSIKNLTIYTDSKTSDNYYQNIYIKKDIGLNSFQITYAKKAKFIQKGEGQYLELYNGETINKINNNISKFSFKESDFSFENYETGLVKIDKIQETSTKLIFSCLNRLLKLNMDKIFIQKNIEKNINCTETNLKNIYQELYKRFIIPFYIIILILISQSLLLNSKEQSHYKKYKLIIFLLGLFFIIFSETTLKLIKGNFEENIKFIILPFIIIFILYAFFFKKFKSKYI